MQYLWQWQEGARSGMLARETSTIGPMEEFGFSFPTHLVCQKHKSWVLSGPVSKHQIKPISGLKTTFKWTKVIRSIPLGLHNILYRICWGAKSLCMKSSPGQPLNSYHCTVYTEERIHSSRQRRKPMENKTAALPPFPKVKMCSILMRPFIL